MKFLIVEDEPLIAKRLRRMIEEILPHNPIDFSAVHDLDGAIDFINQNQVDLCFLDLNLSGQNGFDLIRSNNRSFETIVTSAYGEKALKAFEFEVLDFVPKPYIKQRLSLALERFISKHGGKDRTLLVQCGDRQKVIALHDVAFIKAAGNYSQVECLNGNQFLHGSPIGELTKTLSEHFYRVHKSYLVPIELIDSLHKFGGGKYELTLKSGKSIPISRSIFGQLELSLAGK